jgi:hypothetical protein
MPDACKITEDNTFDLKGCVTMKLIGKVIPLSAWAPKACEKILPTDFVEGLVKSKTVSKIL